MRSMHCQSRPSLSGAAIARRTSLSRPRKCRSIYNKLLEGKQRQVPSENAGRNNVSYQ